RKFQIDFNRPEYHIPALQEAVSEVEKECPVAKEFGFSGVGEGLVFKCITPGWESSKFWFKAKGDEHSAGKVHKLPTVDPEKLETIDAFVVKHVNNERLTQAWDWLKEMDKELSEKSTGDFIKW